jgi:DHA1 family tetracycline resistance protein-like MFS transporter
MTQDGGGAAAQAGHSREDGGARRARHNAASDRSRQGRRRNALVFILVTILLDSMALGMVAPVLPKLITQVLAGHPLSPRIAQSLPGGGVALAAAVYGLFNTVFALMQFFFSPVIGSLSDRFGRRPLILASNIGLGLNYLLLAWAPNLVWLFVGRLLSGITGASFGTASAYIADTTPPERRSEAFGMVGAAFGLGLVIGPGLGGLLSDVSARLPFVVAGALSLANAAYGLLVLPESLPRSMRSGFSWKRANPVGSLILLRRHPDLFGLAGVAFLSNLAQVALGSTVVLYAMHRFGWTTGRVGVTLAVTGIAMALVQVFVVGPVVKRVGNRWTMIAGLSFGAVALFWAGVAPNQVLFWAGIPLIALWGLFGAANQTLMTRHVKPIEQGQLQGANASITGISELIGPLIFTLIFAYFVTPGHNIAEAGAPFLMGGLILSAAAIWGVISTRDEREPDV